MLRSPGLWLLGSLLLSLSPGCGGDGIRHANVSPGVMPAGQTFTGVWHSPQYGEMQMVQTGSQVVGEYTQDERHGRIQGTAQGDLMRFEWTEQRELVMGRPTTTRGHGYFQFQIGADTDSYIVGEWGHDQNETGGGPWRAARDRRRQPHMGATTTGGATESTSGSGGGDSMEDLGPAGSGSGSRSTGTSSGTGTTSGSDLGLDGL